MFIGEALKIFKTPEALIWLYIYIIFVYVGNKEVIERWIRNKFWKPRPGELLLLLWGLAILLIFIAEYLSHRRICTPPLMLPVFQTLLGTFILSIGSKSLYEKKVRKK